MRKIINNLFVVLLMACAVVGCKEEVDYGDHDRTSVVTLSKSAVNIGWEGGSSAEITVTVPRFGWKAEYDAHWLSVTPDTTNLVGSTQVTLLVMENTSEEPREAVVTFLSGNVEQKLNVKQVGYGQIASDVNHPDGNANKWMFEVLKERYLWNTLLEDAYPDYACNYNNFLANTLIPLKGNELDGGRIDGARYLYSTVSRVPASATRSGEQTRAGVSTLYPSFGIATIGLVSVDEDLVYLRVTSINPESPAERAEIQRGEYIGEINGEEITRVNVNAMCNKLLYPNGGSIQLTMMRSSEFQGEFYFSEDRKVNLSTANIGNNPVVAYSILEHVGKKVGYVAYNSFVSGVTSNPTAYDLELQNVFDEFVAEGIDELVVDLRYNNGGLVSSCQKLCSMIAPSDKLGEVAFTLRHNEQLEATLPESQKKVKLLTSYAESNVNMSRVYFIVSDQSASASEMVIVGMEGLGVDVTVVGLTTEGKNVGMEVITKYVDGYNYEFSPVTFQIFNAKDESNYSTGIRADYEVDEWGDLRSDGWKPLGDPEEVMLNMALNLITGNTTRSFVEVSPAPQIQNRFERLKYNDPNVLRGALLTPEVEQE